MSTIWFTADLHFGHSRISELSHRPFANVAEMNQTLLENWNTLVGPDDIGWILGDLAIEGSWRAGLEYAEKMNGRLRLITGNHDQAWTGKSTWTRYQRAYLDIFEAVVPWGRAKIGPAKVNLSHFPYLGDHTEEDRFEGYRLPLQDRPIIHGHTHSQEKFSVAHLWQPDGRVILVPQLHVGVDAWDFSPVPIHQLERLLEDWYNA
jgi:calcineurin-like phosphoesterase family protein